MIKGPAKLDISKRYTPLDTVETYNLMSGQYQDSTVILKCVLRLHEIEDAIARKEFIYLELKPGDPFWVLSLGPDSEKYVEGHICSSVMIYADSVIPYDETGLPCHGKIFLTKEEAQAELDARKNNTEC